MFTQGEPEKPRVFRDGPRDWVASYTAGRIKMEYHTHSWEAAMAQVLLYLEYRRYHLEPCS